MAGTTEGGLKAAATVKAKFGTEFYREIGRLGGKNGHTGGFAANPELAREAGRKGGHISKRGKAKKKPANSEPMARGAETAKKWRKEIEEYERIYG